MNPIQHLLLLAVRAYRWTLSPAKTFLFGPLGQCRFAPSCSEYAIDAIKTHGAAAGTWLGMKRICRCHPWGDCGHDPVPAKLLSSSSPQVRPSLGEGGSRSKVLRRTRTTTLTRTIRPAAGAHTH